MIDALFNVAVFAMLTLCIVGFCTWANKRVSATLIKGSPLREPQQRTIVLATNGQARREASASLYASMWQPLIRGVPMKPDNRRPNSQTPSINPSQKKRNSL